jgi:beta-glucanase (GH16 family)
MRTNQIKKCCFLKHFTTCITFETTKPDANTSVIKTTIWTKSRRVLFLFFVLLLLSAQSLMADPQWTLVWDAEFKGPANSSPDPTYWTFDTGGGGWGNGELETYTNTTANAYQDGNGHLVIQALNNNGNYTSARMKTQGVFNHAYGMVEASIQLPAGGSGVWPAFWMLGQNIGSVSWPACGEIDMMEDGLPWSNTVFGGHVHGPMSNGGDYNGGAGVGMNTTLPSGTVNSGFHTYGVQWSPNQIQFFVDGSIYQTLTPAGVPGTWVFNHPFFILLNLAVGGPSGSPGGTAFPQQMLVSYVRVYKLTDNGTSSYGGTMATIPGTVQAENYDTYNDSTDPTEPGEGLAYNALQTGNTSGQYRTGDAISIENCSDAGGGYDVDWTSPGQWMQYTLNVTQSGSYNIDARVSSSGPGGTFHFDLDGTPITGEMTCPDTGGWQNWQDVVAGAGNISAGRHVLLLVEDTMGAGDMGVCNFNYISMNLVNPPTQTPTVTATATLTYSRTNTFTETATATSTGTPSNTFTPFVTETITATPYFSFTVTQTLTPVITFTAPITATWTFTAAATAASTGTLTPNFSYTATQTATPSFTASLAITAEATATLSVGPSATESQTPEATAVFTATQSETTPLTRTSTYTPAQTFTATLTPQISKTATPGTGLLVYPDPYDPGDNLPMHVSFNCAAGTVSIKIEFWSRAFRLIRQYETSLSAPEATQGKIDLDSSIFENFSNGVYYITAITSHDGAGQAVSKIEKFLIIRKNRP